MSGSRKSRGGLGRLGRAYSVLRNYGVSSQRFEESLVSFGKFLRGNDCPATFACTSSLLGKSEVLVSFLARFDAAIHGKEHIDYTQVTDDRFVNDLREAMADFEAVGLRPRGFRAPYLRWNGAMIRAIADAGLEYDSSTSSFWNVGPLDLEEQDEVRNVLQYYSSDYEAEVPSLPKVENGVVRMPVSLPDDEILIERMGISHPDELATYWTEMLESSYKKAELLVLQIHPERFPNCGDALLVVLHELRKREIWVATLTEVASWWAQNSLDGIAWGERTSPDVDLWPSGYRSAFCLTGDIDAMSMGDFIRRRSSRKTSGQGRVRN